MSDAILVLNFALCAPNPAKLHTDVGASTRAFSRGRLTAICSSEQHVSRLLSCSLPALACEFEVAGLAPGPRLISAILEYAILAGSLLSPYLRARLTNFACGLVDTHNPSSWVVCER